MAYIEFDHVVKEYPSGSSVIRALDEGQLYRRTRRIKRDSGTVRCRQNHGIEHSGRHGYRHNRPRSGRRARYYGPAEKGLVTYRRNDIGFVFQFYNLVPNLTALENVELVLTDLPPIISTRRKPLYKGRTGGAHGEFPGTTVRRRTTACIHRPRDCQKPKLLLCDEPTGAPDYETGKEVLQLLQDICQTQGMTVMIITHNSALAPMAHKVIRFRSGKVTSEEVNATRAAHRRYRMVGDWRCSLQDTSVKRP